MAAHRDCAKILGSVKATGKKHGVLQFINSMRLERQNGEEMSPQVLNMYNVEVQGK